ncbi:hypothetical protein KFE25_002866 [Diacronema lutheri]|uniref:Uncharacterized protein n=1 Tax=Diacronema lutheri TaxID=2081491 RepID=A0A8J5XS38_DIALT|nr:hypothetical protein KFE25_002866 [Diacronema lutheri]
MLAASLATLTLAYSSGARGSAGVTSCRAESAATLRATAAPREARARAHMGLFGRWGGYGAADDDDDADVAGYEPASRARAREAGATNRGVAFSGGNGGSSGGADTPDAWARADREPDDDDDAFRPDSFPAERRTAALARAPASSDGRRRARPPGSARSGGYVQGLDERWDTGAPRARMPLGSGGRSAPAGAYYDGYGAYSARGGNFEAYDDADYEVGNVYEEPLVSLSDFEDGLADGGRGGGSRARGGRGGALGTAPLEEYEIGTAADPRMAEFARSVRAESDWRLNLFSAWLRLWGDPDTVEPDSFFEDAPPRMLARKDDWQGVAAAWADTVPRRRASRAARRAQPRNDEYADETGYGGLEQGQFDPPPSRAPRGGARAPPRGARARDGGRAGGGGWLDDATSVGAGAQEPMAFGEDEPAWLDAPFSIPPSQARARDGVADVAASSALAAASAAADGGAGSMPGGSAGTAAAGATEPVVGEGGERAFVDQFEGDEWTDGALDGGLGGGWAAEAPAARPRAPPAARARAAYGAEAELGDLDEEKAPRARAVDDRRWARAQGPARVDERDDAWGRRDGYEESRRAPARRAPGPALVSVLRKLDALRLETDRTAERLHGQEAALLSEIEDARLRADALAALRAQMGDVSNGDAVERSPVEAEDAASGAQDSALPADAARARTPPPAAQLDGAKAARLERQSARLAVELERLEADIAKTRERLALAQSGLRQVDEALAAARQGGLRALAQLATSRAPDCPVSPSFQAYLRGVLQLRPAAGRK